MGQQNLGNIQLVTMPIQGNQIIPASQAFNIPASSIQSAFSLGTSFGLGIADTPVTKIFAVGQPTNSGFFTGCHASIYTPGSASSLVVDFLKNGVTICSGGTITLTNASTAKAQYNATLSIVTFNAGDILTISVTVSSSTGMAGLFAAINGYEIANPQ